MKKIFTSVLAVSVLTGGAESFAAQNPFEDVPKDHWAYEAVAELAANGVIEGYGDGTYRGEQEITRYEMAQMIARAMTKNRTGTDKILIDKLAAEFSEELNSLGVRVANLEKRVDSIKFPGRVRYRYNSKKHEKEPSQNVNQLLLRLEPVATINTHWTGRARIDYMADMDSARNVTSSTLDRAYVEGKYGSATIALGKFWQLAQADYGLFLDDSMTGGQVIFGKALKAALTIGRYNLNNRRDFGAKNDADKYDTVSYQGVEIYNDRAKNFTYGMGYHHLRNDSYFKNLYGEKGANIWDFGMGYKLTKNLNLQAAYTKNTKGKGASKHLRAYNIALNYKGADPRIPGSFGITAVYHAFGHLAVIHPTHDIVSLLDHTRTIKGWEAGFSYTFEKNIVGSAYYFRGKSALQNQSDKDYSNIFAEVNFFF